MGRCAQELQSMWFAPFAEPSVHTAIHRFPARSGAFTVCVSSSLLLTCSGASADEEVGHTIDRVVVTSNRVEQPLSRVGGSITVIEAEEIRASQKTTLADLLVTTPGVSYSRNGGIGGTTSVRIRGAESEQTVVLLDGVKLNDPSSPGGGFNFGNLLTTEYSRVEVLRGPQSTLWGSQAIGGVINIVTPLPEGPLTASVSAEGGTHDTALIRAHAEAGSDRFAWRVAGAYLTTDGISAFDRDLGGVEDDGYRNTGFHARGLYRITENVSAEVRSTWSKGRLDFDGFPPPRFTFADTPEHGDTDEVVTYAGLNLTAFDGHLENRIGFAYTDTDRTNYDPSSSVPVTFDASGRNKRWEYQGTLTLTDRVNGVIGLESERSELSTASPSPFEPNPVPFARDVRIDSAYAQFSVSPIEPLTLTAGVRYDDHDAFGNKTTSSGSLAWSATESTIVRASYGEGFKTPTLFQLYSEFGTASLAPEQAEGWDAGIEQRLFGDALVVSAIYFNRDTTNMIDFVSCFASTTPQCLAQPDGYYDNVQKTATDGIELALAANLGERLSVTANYTNMDAENDARGSANFGRALARRPKEMANAEVSYAWPIELRTAIAVEHAGRSFDNASNTAVLDGYTLVDFRASYSVSESLEVFGRIENAFDEDYETTRRYGTLGRTFFAGLRQTF
jgi:vitamin B12 transporter